MRFDRNGATSLVLLCVLTCAAATGQNKRGRNSPAREPNATEEPTTSLLGPDDGLAVISAALDARTRRRSKIDCSHLVHEIYERAGFSYEYANSSDLYDGSDKFRQVAHPQPGDLVVWPGHVGIVVNPAQRSFYSALRSGLGVDAYDSTYWKDRGRARFFRYVKAGTAADGNGQSRQ